MDKREFSARRRIWGGTMRGLMLLCAAVTCALAVFLIVYVLVKGVPNLSWQLLSTKPSYLDGSIGILPDIITTVCTVLTTLLVVLPLGVCAAVYLTEYAKIAGWWRSSSLPPRRWPASLLLSMHWWAISSFAFRWGWERPCWQAR